MLIWNQLKSILWKNWLLKRAHFPGFLAELLLPVAFMALLILIKSITDVYDSPSVSYYCGNVYPWFYTDSLLSSVISLSTVPFICTQKPDQCSQSHYYEEPLSITIPQTSTSLSGYSQYGYIPSSLSASSSSNPFYAYTLADNTQIYSELGIDNPSLPLNSVLSRMRKHKALLAITINSNDASEQQILNYYAAGLRNFILNQTLSNTSYSNTVVLFSSEGALNDYITDTNYDDSDYKQGKVGFAVVFNSIDVETVSWDYSIRANYTGFIEQDQKTVACLYSGCEFTYTIPSTKFITADLLKPQDSKYMYGYTYSGFSTLQLTVDDYIFSIYQTNRSESLEYLADSMFSPTTSSVNIRSSVGLMPTNPYKTDSFQAVISSTLGIFYMLSFLYAVSRVIRALVIEKETKIKEGLKIMGVTDFVYNISWFITIFLQLTLVAILITLVTSTSVFEYSNKIYVFIYFEAFSLSIMGMCFLLATFFSRSKTASLLGPMIFFASYFPYYAVNDPQFSTEAKTATCILAPACFALGANVFADYEGGLVGIQSSNIDQSTSNFTYNAVVGMLFLDAFLYGILAWYLDKVIPSEYGTSMPFYFPVLPSYWCGVKVTFTKPSSSGTVNVLNLFGRGYYYANEYARLSTDGHHPDAKNPIIDDDDYAIDEENEGKDGRGELQSYVSNNNRKGASKFENKYLEEVSADLMQQVPDQKAVSIRGLRKVFPSLAGGEPRVAVHGLDLDLFQGQITVLLGHNGAGKTTTISMLVGLIPSTSGYALMPGGLSTVDDMQEIRKTLGVCPQHDVLFPELTVFQHLQIYAAFKGVQSSVVDVAAKKMIAEVGLMEKANSRSSTLSGGQKRKLSLGIALIGDSKVVILDEPTSGMDPYSRRSTWNIIQRNKKGRVILLTTHFMDEADLLGDRIAIMAHGKLQCAGSSLFLKNRFGVGYTLTIVKISHAKQSKENSNALSKAIFEVVKSFVNEAEPLSDVGAEQSFRLPFAASTHFVPLFQELDNQKDKLSIAEYGISVTTLEEVFIRVGEMEDRDAKTDEETTAAIELDRNYEDELLGSKAVQPSFTEQNNVFIVNSSNGTDPVMMVKEPKSEVTTPFLGGPDKREGQYCQNGSLFGKHFYALFAKRVIYGKRDRQMFLCQLILPVLLVIIGVSLLLITPNLSQPDLTLSGGDLNSGLNKANRNYVPFGFDTETVDSTSVASQMMNRFNGDQNNGVYGTAVNILSVDQDTDNVDIFDGCSQGAAPLYNMSSFLLKYSQPDGEGGSSRYGSVTVSSETNATSLIYNVLVNASSIHGVGLFVNLVHQSYLQVVTGVSSATITVHNYPLPRTYNQDIQSATASAFIVSLFTMIAFCFIPASFVTFIVKEREVKAKHQQIISGVSIYAYWCSTYLWDILSYIPTALLVFAMMYAYDVTAYTQGDGAGAAFLLLLCFGPAVAAFTYMISFLFVSHSTAQIVIMFLNFITGLCLMVVSFVLTTISSTSEINLSLRYLYRLFPSFCLGDGLIQLALCVNGDTCPLIGKDGYELTGTQGPYSWDIAGGNIAFLAIEVGLYFVIAIAIEFGLTFPALMSWLYHVEDPGYALVAENEDEDVLAERNRVLSGAANGDVVRIQELRKVYPANSRLGGINIAAYCNPFSWYDNNVQMGSDGKPKKKVKVAVQSLCFGIPNGQCFGFLGINGAGKTTTLSILSGEFPPTAGTAFIDGYNIQDDQSNIRRKIGYCPQFDALLELLTVREHLELYARIKGLTGLELKEVVESKIQQLDLADFENKTAGSLSGGNKRKLSVAIATIGNPSIVFLDEPSTGMDPVARRFMWRVIARMSTQDAQCSVILTTHSMEEAEALCTRIGVMVNGRLCCLGSGQHLKHRFGNGFEVNIKTESPQIRAIVSLAQTIRSNPSLHLTIGEGKSPNARIMNTTDSPILSSSPLRSNPTRAHSGADNQSYHTIGLASTSKDDEDRVEEYVDILIKREDIGPICIALANPQRQHMISPTGSGCIVYDVLQSEGSINLKSFVDWWIAEDIAEQLKMFMRTSFGPERAILLERSTSQCFRYRVKISNNDSVGDKNALSEIFSKFEERKSELHIQEYSVGQTTLEQIFNQFAAMQDNPEVESVNQDISDTVLNANIS